MPAVSKLLLGQRHFSGLSARIFTSGVDSRAGGQTATVAFALTERVDPQRVSGPVASSAGPLPDGTETMCREISRGIARAAVGATILLVLLKVNARPLQAAPLIRSLTVAEGLERPIFATSAPGDSSRLYVLEQGSSYSHPAAVRVVDLSTGQLQSQPMLSMDDWQFYDLGGALGLAFDPNFELTRRFYVSGTEVVGGQPMTTVREYQTSLDNPLVADPLSARTIAQFPSLGGNHNGGWIGFGPDGLLYWARGDGRSGAGQGLVAQDLGSLFGKMLRIDVRRDDFPADPQRNYGIPADNPFTGEDDALDEIWAWGLRHPWRNSFDRQTGAFYVADVGSNRWEEVNFQVGGAGGGANYGWPYREGLFPNPNFSGEPDTPIDPVYSYERGEGLLSAITGGYVYRGSALPELDGTYFFADFPTNRVFSIRYDGQSFGELTDWTFELVDRAPESIGGIASFAEDASGELYLIDYVGGRLFQIAPGLIGDADDDCAVGAADYAIWAAQFGQTGSGLSADFDRDGQVGLADYTLWAANFGRTCDDPLGWVPAAIQVVPEPTTLGLAFSAGLLLWGCQGFCRRGSRG